MDGSICVLEVEPGEGWLGGVRRVHSPNADARPDPSDVSLLVIHGITVPPGVFGDRHIERLFTNRLAASDHPDFDALRRLEVSAHVLVHRTGAVTQFVPFERRAWHAGVSSFRGRARCNDFSIGIELEGTDDVSYTDSQYAVLGAIVAAIGRRWPAIGPDAVTGHSDIAPGRKTDPGRAFDWQRLRRDAFGPAPES